jgi:hypothetical protein
MAWPATRVRGDHDRHNSDVERYPGSPPRTRGPPHGGCAGRQSSGITPRTRGPPPPHTPTGNHPRVRGDHRCSRSAGSRYIGSPPRTRVPPSPRRSGGCIARITPAYAGTTRSSRWRNWDWTDHPRVRGDHKWAQGSRPRFRGITPAYAGTTRRLLIRCPTTPDHPRVRGDHMSSSVTKVGSYGSPPRTRGPRGDRRPRWHPLRITPAYAGTTPKAGHAAAWARDHPRVRGDHGWGWGIPVQSALARSLGVSSSSSTAARCVGRAAITSELDAQPVGFTWVTEG